MAYRGSEAYRLDMAERQARWQDHEPFSIVEGVGYARRKPLVAVYAQDPGEVCLVVGVHDLGCG